MEIRPLKLEELAIRLPELVVVNTPDPVLLLEQLLHSSHMPPLCTQGVLDPVPARTAILLHDLSDPESPGQEELAQKLERVKARFTPHLALAVQVDGLHERYIDTQVASHLMVFSCSCCDSFSVSLPATKPVKLRITR